MNNPIQKYASLLRRQRRESFFVIAIIALFSLSLVARAAEALGAKRKTELIHLLKQDCGSCHGMTLKGGLGPSLLPGVMKSRNKKLIRRIILDGVPDTPMPPWRGLLSAADITYLIDLMQNGVPNE